MSRIGKMPISVPGGVSVDLKGTTITVKGPKGTLSRTLHPSMEVEQESDVLNVKRPTNSNPHRSLHGLTRTLVNNMVVGVSNGFNKTMLIEGVGYRAEMDGKVLVLSVGYSHPIRFQPENNVQFAVENRGKTIIVSGIDKEVVGETAAKIRKMRPPEPYKGKGILYAGEIIRRKAGKTGKV